MKFLKQWIIGVAGFGCLYLAGRFALEGASFLYMPTRSLLDWNWTIAIPILAFATFALVWGLRMIWIACGAQKLRLIRLLLRSFLLLAGCLCTCLAALYLAFFWKVGYSDPELVRYNAGALLAILIGVCLMGAGRYVKA